MAENDLLTAYKQIPVITRLMLTGVVLVSFAVKLRFLPYYMIHLDWSSIIFRFQLQRLITPFLVTGVSFNMLFDLYFLFNYGSQLETATFAGRTADFAWFVIFTCLSSTVGAYFLNVSYLFEAMLVAVIYLWSRINSERLVSFMFGVTFPAAYFPWVLIAYNYVMTGAMVPWAMLIGVGSAHLYYFLDTVYPSMGGPRLIPTPTLLYRAFPAARGFQAGGNVMGGQRANAATAATAAAEASGHRWGTGQRLGQ
ncbi:Derlin 1 [Lunasporangiospora selenospora]|uniref:Derlin n=1 Tax=Lunasporangiospora selenospora TaxID=979761 RepID=A0A9P6G178_9FUNG|nr:Derlin 1 [Lunasporangiospora selenospora]